MTNIAQNMQNDIMKSFQSAFGKEEMFARIIECFPYPIQIFSIDGTARMINKAAIDVIGIKRIEDHVGKYNVFKDPIVQGLGVMNQVRQVLTGKTVYLSEFNAPYRDMIQYLMDRYIQCISSDITCFPLLNDDGGIEYFAAVFIIKNIYRGKEEIALGRQYIETHWMEPFDLDKTAKAACLSKAHFAKLFKKHIGVTAHEYYINYKIGKLREKLLDMNLSIAQAFAACNLDYNGHSARVFKEKQVLPLPSTGKCISRAIDCLRAAGKLYVSFFALI